MILFIISSLFFSVFEDTLPVADFSIAPQTFTCGQSVFFDANSSYHNSPSYSIIKYEWDYDYDGVTFNIEGSGISVSHTYSGLNALNTHNVALKVTDNQEPHQINITTKIVEANISNTLPIANTGGPYSTASVNGEIQTIVLDASLSVDTNEPCGGIVLYEWDSDGDGLFGLEDTDGSLFGPGSDAIGKQPRFYGLYLTNNLNIGVTQTISLRVTNSFGFLSSIVDTQISVLTEASFSETPVAIADVSSIEVMEGCSTPNEGKVTFFHDKSYQILPTKPIVEYQWLFDTNDNPDFDATDWASIPEETIYNNSWHSSNKNSSPVFQYMASGTYTAALRVVNELGAVDIYIIKRNIRVLPQPDRYPTANAGAAYEIRQDSILNLNGTLSTDPNITCGDALTYSWDVNDNGIYADASGNIVQLSWSELESLLLQAGLSEEDYIANPETGLPSITISLEVEDLSGLTNVDATTLTIYLNDFDNDGYDYLVDCNDSNPNIHPGALEVADGVDNDCDGMADNGTDVDGDGYYAEYGDCDDAEASTNPAGTDIAGTGVDANCDGTYLWYVDADGDTYGTSSTVASANPSPGAGESATADDCDDAEASTNPGATEIAASGTDANCDSQYLWYVDSDGDTYGSTLTIASANTIPGPGESATADDCDDAEALTNPAGTDIAGTGIDANCDGTYLWYVDADGDTYGTSSTIASANPSPGVGESATADDCDDAEALTNPAGTDIAGSGVDANCDSNYLWYVDADGDTYGSTLTIASANTSPGAGESATADDCDDAEALTNPAGTDIAGSGIDANCDSNYLWYVDADTDGYGSATTISSANSSPGTGESANADDCNDTDQDVYAGAPALADGKDNDCDGTVDKITQTISFDAIEDIEDGAADIILSASASSLLAVSYTVTGPGSVSGNTLTITGAGSVTVTASQTGDNGYLPAADVEQIFCVNPIPEIAINLQGSIVVTLTSNYATGNQWYLDDNLISNATDQSLAAEAGGFYKVEVSIDGCVGTSTDTEILLTGYINEILSEELSIYPMPVSSKMNVITGSMPEGNYTLRVIDLNGKTQIMQQLTVSKNNTHHEVRLDAIPQGIYTVVMQHNENIFIRRVVKQ